MKSADAVSRFAHSFLDRTINILAGQGAEVPELGECAAESAVRGSLPPAHGPRSTLPSGFFIPPAPGAARIEVHGGAGLKPAPPSLSILRAASRKGTSLDFRNRSKRTFAERLRLRR